MRTRLNSLIAVTILAVGCSGTAPSSASPAGQISQGFSSVPATASGPTTIASSTAIASPTASPSASPTSSSGSALAWHRIGSIDAHRNIVGFARGYVVVGYGDRAVQFSPDGISWTTYTLPFQGVALGDQARSIATDGTTVVIVGTYGHAPCTPSNGAGGGPPCQSSPISWVSTDGKTWRTSYPWRGPAIPKPYHQGSEFSTVWAVPTGGWDAALMYVAGEAGAAAGIFHSDDGLIWKALPSAPPTALKESAGPPEVWHLGVADQAGRRLIAGYWYPGSVVRLITSSDGTTWTILKFGGADVGVEAAIAPVQGGAPLWMIGGRDAAGIPTVWTSPDLAVWSAHGLTASSVDAQGAPAAMSATHLGYVALGGQTSWVSSDGIDWVQLAASGEPGEVAPDTLADGPAGVLGVSCPDDDSCVVLILK